MTVGGQHPRYFTYHLHSQDRVHSGPKNPNVCRLLAGDRIGISPCYQGSQSLYLRIYSSNGDKGLCIWWPHWNCRHLRKCCWPSGQTSHQYTGRAMVIPKSYIFDHPLENVSGRISICSTFCVIRPNSCTRNLDIQLIPAHSFKTERPSYGIQRFAFSVKVW